MKKSKDEQLGKLFEKYISESSQPGERVKAEAEAALADKEREPAYEGEPVLAGADGGGYGAPTKRKVWMSAGIALLACVAAVIVYLLLSQYLFAAKDIVLEVADLSRVETAGGYEEKEFVPFVKEGTVSKYEEFELNEESPYYEEYEGDVILYYLQYESSGVTVDLFIEIDGFMLEALDGYLEIEDDYEAGDLLLYIEMDEITGSTYVYFCFDIYQYYFEIHSVDTDVVTSVLEEIVFSF